ncbi:MAG TPA: glycoside hydrolase domain-containing protein [Candidatus Angelobacter sp.]|nr:glycoside hydrolase domain-containing protein [Candidatus Angelobacter sp.]
MKMQEMKDARRTIAASSRGARGAAVRLIGLFLAGAMFSILSGGAAWASDQLVIPSTEAQQIQSMHLLNSNTGWVAGRSSLMITHDGGLHWSESAPLGPDTGAIESVFFLDELQGWVVSAAAGEQGEEAAAFIISSTVDGGATWADRKLVLPEEESGSSIALSFVDADHGWIMVRKPSSSNFSRGALLATDNGGINWRLLPEPPIGDAVRFTSPTTGWLAGGAAHNELYVTRDGGHHWQVQSVLASDAAHNVAVSSYQLPEFRNERDGALTVFVGEPGKPRVAVFETHDGGTTWGAKTSVPLSEDALQAGGAVTSVIDANTLFVAPRSRDQFTAVTQGSPRNQGFFAQFSADEAITGLDFNDDHHGWVLVTSGHCDAVKSQCHQDSRLFSTNDGGSTLNAITPPMASNGTLTLANKSTLIDAGAPTIHNTAVVNLTAKGFDQCAAGTVSQMQHWFTNTPWSFANIYMGGSNRACSQANLTSSWVNSIFAQGWDLVPTWVGLQAPGSSCTGCSQMSSNTTTAKQQGINEANAATSAANSLGLTPPTVIYFDLERYDPTSNAAAAAFVEGWVTRLHQLGNRAGVYGSAANAAADWATIANPPDAVWIASWNGSTSVFGLSGLSDSLWTNHQRIHQFEGGHNETWGGVTFNIDSDSSDGPVAHH